MTLPDTTRSIGDIAPDTIEAFHSERLSILSAVHERRRNDTTLREHLGGETEARIAHESARILAENVYVCVKYGLPAALTEYLDWLRVYLGSRSFPVEFLPRLLQALQMASVAFLPAAAADQMSTFFHELRAHVRSASQEVAA